MSSLSRTDARTRGRKARKEVSGAAREAAEGAICTTLLQVESIGRAAIVGAFVADDGEPSLQTLIDVLWRRGTMVAIPALVDDPNDFSMRFLEWRAQDQLVPHRFGIPVPAIERPVIPDALVVPLVGFDEHCNRIGRGAGFYDRWLSDHDATKVGAAFEVQRLGQVPTEDHDVGLDAVVTELGIRHAPLRFATKPPTETS